MITAKKHRVMLAIRDALDYCGYNMSELLGNHTRRREYVDLRSIIWTIYQDATMLSEAQIGLDFEWNRATVFCAIRKARELRKVDANFSDMYDSIQGAFNNALSKLESEINSKANINN